MELRRLCDASYSDAEVEQYWITECKPLDRHIVAGTLCATRDATVAFASTLSWQRLGGIGAGRLLVAQGAPERVEAYFMVPIRPLGAVEVSHLEVVSLGARVRIRGEEHIGFVRYFGSTQFADGLWVGVECEKPVGRHDGSINGVAYFSCPDNHGLFVKPRKLRLAQAPSPRKSSGMRGGLAAERPNASPQPHHKASEATTVQKLQAELAAARRAAAHAEGELVGQRRVAEAAVVEFHEKWRHENIMVAELRVALAEERRLREALERQLAELRGGMLARAGLAKRPSTGGRSRAAGDESALLGSARGTSAAAEGSTARTPIEVLDLALDSTRDTAASPGGWPGLSDDDDDHDDDAEFAV